MNEAAERGTGGPIDVGTVDQQQPRHRRLAIGHRRSVFFRRLLGIVARGDHADRRRAPLLARRIACGAPLVVGTAARGDAFSVILMSGSNGRTVVGEASESADRVIEELEKLRLPHGNADLNGTLTAITTLLKDSPVKYARKEVFFFTDLQSSTWIAQQSSSVNMLLQTFKERKVDTVFVDVGQGVDRTANDQGQDRDDDDRAGDEQDGPDPTVFHAARAPSWAIS